MEYILPNLVYALGISIVLQDFGEGWSSVSRQLQGDLLSFGITIALMHAYLKLFMSISLGLNNSVKFSNTAKYERFPGYRIVLWHISSKQKMCSHRNSRRLRTPLKQHSFLVNGSVNTFPLQGIRMQ
jgi:hypothetical protein